MSAMLSNVPLYVLIIAISTPVYITATLLKRSPITITLSTVLITYLIILYLLYSNGFHLEEDASSSILISAIAGITTGIFIHTYLLWLNLSNKTPNKRSCLLTVSQQRSQALIELLYRKALVAAKAWASLYPSTMLLSIQGAQYGLGKKRRARQLCRYI